MKFHLYIILLSFSIFCKSQKIESPIYISTKQNHNIQKLERTSDIYFFYLKPIQYIGEAKKNISIQYNNYDGYNPIIKDNYAKPDDTLHKEFNGQHYDNIKIFVDTGQSTPLIVTYPDSTKINRKELDDELDRMNEGEKPTKEIPIIETYYEGYPITISNLKNKNVIIGFGNNAALGLEALKDNKWKKVYDFRRYNCGVGIKYILLKPNQIATVFEPVLKGNMKTKFRYRLGDSISNEFEGSINDEYLSH